MIAFILGASAVITALIVIWSKAVKPFYEKWIKPVKEVEEKRVEMKASLDELSVKMSEMDSTLKGVLAELKPNGGESVRDAINRIENKVDYGNAKLRFRDQLTVNPTFEMDAKGNCIFANRSLCDLLDIDESDFLNRRWLSVFESEFEKSHLLQQWLDAAINKIPMTLNYKVRVKGDLKNAIIRAEPALNRKDELVGFLCLLDIQGD